MSIFEITLLLATFLCSLSAGFLLAFAIVTMPGLKNLDDKAFIRAFQVIDDIIQNFQPIFMLVWIGSVVALIVSTVLGVGQLDDNGRLLIIYASLIYIFGVQVPTGTINVPMNNKLQTLDVNAMNEVALKAAREDFEPRWNQWNVIRTILASIVSSLLIYLTYLL